MIREKLRRAPPTRCDRAAAGSHLGLPDRGPQDEPIADAVLAEINGWDADGKPLVGYTELKSDGSTLPAAGSTAVSTPTGSTRRPAASPAREQNWVATSGAGPGRPTGGCSTTAPRPTRTASRGASARPGLVGRGAGQVDRRTTSRTSSPTARRPTGRRRRRRGGARSPAPTRSSCRPTARRGCTRRPGWSTARCPRTTSRRNRRCPTRSTASSTTRSARSTCTRRTGSSPAARARVATSSRTWSPPTGSPSTTPRAACRRFLPYLAELQPEFFCEVSPELAAERGLEHRGWATIVTARNAIEARVLVTDRMHAAAARAAAGAPDRAALPLGPERPDHRRLGERAVAPGPGPERAHPGGQGLRLSTSSPAGGRAGLRGAGPGLPRRAGITDETGTGS